MSRAWSVLALSAAGLWACTTVYSEAPPAPIAVPVGAVPVALAASPDGRTVVSVSHPATVSLIDVLKGAEIVRLKASLRSAKDRLVDATFGSAGVVWVTSTGGEVFSIDLQRPKLRRVLRTEEPLQLTAIVWDDARSRVIVGDVEGSIHVLQKGTLREIHSCAAPVVDLERHGKRLCFIAAEGGIGPTNSYLGAYDLAEDETLFEHEFKDHAFGDLAVTADRIWVAEFGGARLLEFTVEGKRIATRYLSPDAEETEDGDAAKAAAVAVPRFAIAHVAASKDRVVIASSDKTERRILEYKRTAHGFTTLPSGQYAVPGACTVFSRLGPLGFAAGVGRQVSLFPNAKPR